MLLKINRKKLFFSASEKRMEAKLSLSDRQISHVNQENHIGYRP